MSSEWCTIESDPGVFSELIRMLGVKDVAVEELYSMDFSESRQGKSHGLIFLFKWREEAPRADREYVDPSILPDLFFARQVIRDACATQALLSVLLNSPSVSLGAELSEFKSFSISLDAETRGICIGNSESVRLAHNSFARPEPFFHDPTQKRSKHAKEEAYHFIAYVPFQGGVYELDGLKPGPVFLGSYSNEDDWLSVVKPEIESRMESYGASETHFALMHICDEKRALLTQEIETLRIQLSQSANVDADASEQQTISSRIDLLQEQLADENVKLEQQTQENIRRRHNYVPFILELLKALGAKGKLETLHEAARTKREAHRAAASSSASTNAPSNA